MPRRIKAFFFSLLTDFRSASVGSIFGAIVGIITAAWASGDNIDATIYTNESGFAQPMIGLMGNLKVDSAEFTFNPSTLQSVYVCEFARIQAKDPEDLILTYLDKYSSCFSVRQIDSGRYVIEPNNRAGRIERSDGNWLCMCSP